MCAPLKKMKVVWVTWMFVQFPPPQDSIAMNSLSTPISDAQMIPEYTTKYTGQVIKQSTGTEAEVRAQLSALMRAVDNTQCVSTCINMIIDMFTYMIETPGVTRLLTNTSSPSYARLRESILVAMTRLYNQANMVRCVGEISQANMERRVSPFEAEIARAMFGEQFHSQPQNIWPRVDAERLEEMQAVFSKCMNIINIPQQQQLRRSARIRAQSAKTSK